MLATLVGNSTRMNRDKRDVEALLDALEYPASRHDVIHEARGRNAEEEVIRVLQKLPDVKFMTRSELANRL